MILEGFLEINPRPLTVEQVAEFIGIPLDGMLNKVRKGRAGESKQGLPNEIKKELDEIWKNEFAPKTRLISYEDLRKELMVI